METKWKQNGNKICVVFFSILFACLIFGFAKAETYTWEQSNIDTSVTNVTSVVSNEGIIYVSTSSAKVYKSSDGTIWTQINNNYFDDQNNNNTLNSLYIFNNYLYASTSVKTPVGPGYSAEVQRCPISTCNSQSDWETVVDSTHGIPVGSNYIRAINSIYSKDNYLYIGYLYYTTVLDSYTLRISRSLDGSTWSTILTGDASSTSASVAVMATFNSQLYTGEGYFGTGTTSSVYSCTLCDGTDWVGSNTDGFGDSNNRTVKSLAVFNNELYAGTEKSSGNAELWKTSDGSAWTQVGSDGFGDSTTQGFYSLMNYQDHFYLGTYGTTSNAKVWATTNGTDWEQKNSDGFGSSVSNVTGFATVDGYLYAATGGLTSKAQSYRTDLRPTLVPGSVVASQIMDNSGQVSVAFQVEDPDHNTMKAKVEYSVDNGSTWSDQMTFSNPSATFGTPTIDSSDEYRIQNISTSQGTNDVHLTWNANTDLPNANISSVLVRVTGNDGVTSTETVNSSAFSLVLDRIILSSSMNGQTLSICNLKFFFKKLPAKLKKNNAYYLKCDKFKKYPPKFKKAKKMALKKYWKITTNLNKYKAKTTEQKFKIKITYKYTTKQFKNLKKRNKLAKEKNLELFVRDKTKKWKEIKEIWKNAKLKHNLKKNNFSVTYFKKFPQKKFLFSIGLK
ncbi:MAG: hypothetical protein WC663_01205 [Patescibacteria group bacterium]|jgi:hypothetical protein